MTGDPNETDPQHEHEAHVAHPRQVRAGPGDTGASERPTPLPETPEKRAGGWKSILLFCALAAAALIIINVFGSGTAP